MRQVWKYPLGNIYRADGQAVIAPVGGKVLHVGVAPMGHEGELHATRGVQQPVLWIEVDDEAPREQRTFFVVGTGQEVPPGVKHVGTAVLYAGNLILHIYEPDGSGEKGT